MAIDPTQYISTVFSVIEIRLANAEAGSGTPTPTPTPAPTFATQPSVSPASGTAGTTTFTATPGTVSNGSVTSRAWLLNGTSISTALTAAPQTAGTLTYQEFATGAGGNASSAVRTVTVTAAAAVTRPLDANSSMSIGMGKRNGDQYQRSVQGPILTNVFGDGNNAGTAGGKIPGAIAMRVRFSPGEMAATSSTLGAAQVVPIFGSGAQTASRATAVYYYPPTVATGNAGYANRITFFGRDGPGNYMGDRDPATGAGGATGSTRGLRSAPIVADDQGAWTGFAILSLDASGQFIVRTVREDGTVTQGDSFTPTTYTGNAAQTAATRFGSYPTATAAFGQYFPGDLADFIQLDGTHGTDAEWAEVARGADPAAVWGANVAVHYPLGGPDQLAKKSGARAYADATLLGSGHYKGPALRPTRGTTVGTNCLHAWPQYRRYTHALPPEAVRAATSAADLFTKTGTVARDWFVGGAATHIDMCAVREGDDLVLVDWTRVTTTPVSGRVTLTLPGVPTGTYRWLARRADDLSCVAISRDYERVGIVAAIQGQSQDQIALVDSNSVTLDPPTSETVSFCIMRGAAARFVPVDGGPLITRNQLSDAMVGFAQKWETSGANVPLEIVALPHEGRGTTEYMYHGTSDGLDLWGDNVTPSSGYTTAAMVAKRKRITMFLFDWSTRDVAIQNGGVHPAFATPYGTVTPTERPWVERMNELYAGVPKAGATATEIGQRDNYVKLGLVYTPWLVMMGVGRHRDNQNATAQSAIGSFDAFRQTQYNYAVSGTGRAAGILTTFGGWHNDTLLGSADSAHQDRTDPRGNIRYALRWAHAIASASKTEAYDPTPGFSSASRSAGILTLAATLKNGGGTITGVSGAVPAEFEVAEGDDTTWTKTGFTAAISGGIVTITKASGTWAAGTRVAYLTGYPAAVGSASLAAETVLTNGMLYESYANAELALTGAVQGIPFSPVYRNTALVAA